MPVPGPPAQDAVIEVAGPGVASAAGVVGTREVGGRRRHELRAGALAVAVRPVTADAALEEDLLASQQVSLGHRQRVAGEPVAAVDLREVRRLFELAGGHRDIGAFLDRRARPLETGRGGLEALVREHDVLRVQLPGVAEKSGLPAAHLHVRDQLLDLLVGEERLHLRHQRERVDEARVVEVGPLPVVRMPAGLLR